MADTAERLLQWLRDAHAAEEQAETMLSRLADRLVNYPMLKQRIQEHITESQQHARKVSACIERRGGSTSVIKDTGAKIIAFGQGLSGLFVGDEVLKGSIASAAFEAMEIASYRILITAAEEVGDTETAQACRDILADEIRMLGWLDANISEVTKLYLAREEIPGAVAKH